MTDEGISKRGAVGALLVVSAALGGFLILLSVLAFQMRAGHDPAVKPPVTVKQPRVILKRRIIKTRVIIVDPPRTSAGAAAGAATSSRSAPAPVVAVRAAPVPAAPAPAPAPAPVTRTS